MTRFVALLGIFFFLLATAGVGRADEVFSSYHSVIDVAENGTLTVTETITANVEETRSGGASFVTCR